MKNKLLKFALFSPFVLTPVLQLTSCNIVEDFENRPRQIDGFDWIGRKSGYLTEDVYHFDHKNKEIIYWNLSVIQAENLVIPNYIMYMGEKYKVILDNQAFYNCGSSLKGTVELNDFTDEIPEECFYKDKYLTRVIFNKRPKKIGNNAFYHCSNLVEMKYRNSEDQLVNSWAIELEEIGDSAFEGAPVSSEGEPHVEKEILFGPNLTKIGEFAFAGDTLVNKIVLTPSRHLTEIPKNAFFGCSALQKLYLPKELEYIGDAAFSECQNLQFVSFNLASDEIDKEISLGKETFSHCDKLSSFIKNDDWRAQINVKFKEIGDSCFSYDPQLEISQFYANLDYLPDSIFEACNAPEWKLIPNKPKTIGKHALAFNTNLAIIDITQCYDGGQIAVPNDWRPIDEMHPQNAFYGCAKWGQILVREDISTWPEEILNDWIHWFSLQGINIVEGAWEFVKA